MGYGQIRIFNYPFEKCWSTRTIQKYPTMDAKFVQHRPQMTISEIRQMGYDIP